ncbi:hypothetical protein Q3O98_03825 [Ralstonia pseudosolanacearum]|nr:hypothetical protein [Ralstonia pseudosolanacearum]
MKRAAVIVAGILFGLFLTWLCLYTLSHIHWPLSTKPVHGCHELGKCPMQWRDVALLLASLFGPTVLFGLMNGVAWRRWTMRRWSWSAGVLVVLTVVFYAAGYALS